MFRIKTRRITQLVTAGPIQTGFTLIEILVVIMIVGVITGVALLSAPAFLNYVDFKGESKRIKVLLEMLRDESIIQGLEFGFYPEEHGYSFYSFDDHTGIWQKMSQGPYKAYQLPESISLLLEIENKSPAPGQDIKPPVYVFSSGDMTPFKLEVKNSGSSEVRVLISNGYADLEWQADKK